MKKQLLIIGGVAIIMATVSFAGAGSAAGAARNNEGACAVARREREEQREALPAIQNELRQEREARSRRGDVICIDATHVNLKSVLGINEALLTDTNRFAIVESRTGRHTLQLDTPFGGFGEAIVYIDGPLYLRRLIRSRQQNGSAGYNEHRRRLGSIALRRCLPDTATDKEFLSEWQSSCDFVASILGVEAPRVQLANVKEWRKDLANGRSGLLDFRRFSRVIFDVANDQKIVVRLDEPVYAMRDGKVAVVRSGQIFIDIGFRYSPESSNDEAAAQKARKEIDFGPDCADKLAKAILDKHAVLGGGYNASAISKDAEGKIVIPEKLGSDVVTTISSDAFAKHENITSVTIPGSVTNIGWSAFEDNISSVNTNNKCGISSEDYDQMMSKFRNVIKIGEDSRIMSAKIDELNRIKKERGLKFWGQIDHKTLVELDKKYPCSFMVSQ